MGEAKRFDLEQWKAKGEQEARRTLDRLLHPKPKRERKPRQRIKLGDETVTRDELQRRADELARRLGVGEG